MIPRSLPYRRCHRAYPSSTTLGPLGASSSAVNPRPRIGVTPSTSSMLPGDLRHRDALRALITGQGGVSVVRPRGHVLEQPVLLLVVQILRVRRPGLAEVGPAAPDQGQLPGGPVGQRAEQDAVHHAEDRGVGADTEGQGQQDDGGEQRPASQGAHRLADIGEEYRHGQPSGRRRVKEAGSGDVRGTPIRRSRGPEG